MVLFAEEVVQDGTETAAAGSRTHHPPPPVFESGNAPVRLCHLLQDGIELRGVFLMLLAHALIQRFIGRFEVLQCDFQGSHPFTFRPVVLLTALHRRCLAGGTV